MKKIIVTLFLLSTLSLNPETITEKITRKVNEFKATITNKINDITHIVPTKKNVDGEDMYVCGADDCDFCLKSQKDVIRHAVKQHVLNQKSIEDVIDTYQDEDILNLALSVDNSEDIDEK